MDRLTLSGCPYPTTSVRVGSPGKGWWVVLALLGPELGHVGSWLARLSRGGGGGGARFQP
jgi:hypothetical protein